MIIISTKILLRPKVIVKRSTIDVLSVALHEQDCWPGHGHALPGAGDSTAMLDLKELEQNSAVRCFYAVYVFLLEDEGLDGVGQ